MTELQKLILIIDDDPDLREIITLKLTKAGFKVEQAENGEDGITKAKKLQPDLVLMDVRMPKMSGIEALSKMKADSKTAGIKVIFLTNLGATENENAWVDDKFAKEAGALGHIRKTEDLDKIVDRIKEELSDFSIKHYS